MWGPSLGFQAGVGAAAACNAAPPAHKAAGSGGLGGLGGYSGRPLACRSGHCGQSGAVKPCDKVMTCPDLLACLVCQSRLSRPLVQSQCQRPASTCMRTCERWRVRPRGGRGETQWLQNGWSENSCLPSPANQPRSLKPEACVQVVVAMLEPLLEGGPVTQAAAAVVTAIVQVSRGLSAAA